MDFPKNLKYDEKYLWIHINEDVATVGIIKNAAELVKEFVFIQLPELGKIKKGENLVSLEAMKWSGEIDSPLTGEIIEVNNDLFDEPSIINKDPYGKGWIAKIRIINNKELNALLSADERAIKK